MSDDEFSPALRLALRVLGVLTPFAALALFVRLPLPGRLQPVLVVLWILAVLAVLVAALVHLLTRGRRGR